MIDIEKARALCEEASPGPWLVDNALGSLLVTTMDSGLIANPIRQSNAAFIAAARMLLPEALDEIEQLRMDLAVCRGNLGAASEHARDTCACKFDPVTEEPVRRCLYHREQADELERLRKIEAAALALTREWQENIAPPFNKLYELAETLGI